MKRKMRLNFLSFLCFSLFFHFLFLLFSIKENKKAPIQALYQKNIYSIQFIEQSGFKKKRFKNKVYSLDKKIKENHKKESILNREVQFKKSNQALKPSSLTDNQGVVKTKKSKSNTKDTIFIPSIKYPALAKRMKMEGKVIIFVKTNINSEVVAVKVERSSGYELLDQEAVKTIHQGSFGANKELYFPINFKLD